MQRAGQGSRHSPDRIRIAAETHGADNARLGRLPVPQKGPKRRGNGRSEASIPLPTRTITGASRVIMLQARDNGFQFRLHDGRPRS